MNRDEKIIELAIDQHPEGIEFSEDALVSEGDDNGCYVQAWVWVDFAGTALDKGKEAADA